MNDFDLFSLPEEAPHEQVSSFWDAPTGLRAIVAIHSTRRGPAFGGCRMWQYPSESDALRDALRLSHGMSLKNALAGLPFGGGKAVLLRPQAPLDRHRLFQAFGRMVESLNGRYITAEDVGSTTSDMIAVREETSYVSGIAHEQGFGGDPSPMTALGVYGAIDEAVRRILHRPLGEARVAVQGLGAVGMALCRHLHDAGARLTVADIDPARVEHAVAAFSASAEAPDRILTVDCEVLAPCALGGVLSPLTVPRIQARIIAGAANNQLLTPAEGDALHARGVVYLPDFLVNAGGIISAAYEYGGSGSTEKVLREVGRIRERVVQLLEQPGAEPLHRVAERWARERLRPC